MKNLFYLLIAVLGCTTITENSGTNTIDLTLPPETPEFFMKELIQGPFNTRDISISLDGTEIYYTIVAPKNKISAIVYVKKVSDQWSEPEIVSFSGQYSDIEPSLSPDNTYLYYSSTRPDSTGADPKDYDIWKVERKGSNWGDPINLGEVINTDKNEFYPSVTNSGNLYFTAQYEDTKGREDIYISEFHNGNYTQPYSLSDSVNSETWEFNAYVTPDERVIFFSSFGRADDLGGGDLYASIKLNGSWSGAVHLDKVSTWGLDYCPYLDEKNGAFYYTSEDSDIKGHYDSALNYNSFMEMINQPKNGYGNIMWIKAEALNLR